MADATDFQAVLRLVAADARVRKAIGSPAVLMPETVEGTLRRRSAELAFDLSGPRGHAHTTVSAVHTDGSWSIDALDVDAK